jgi:hypothetical protein
MHILIDSSLDSGKPFTFTLGMGVYYTRYFLKHVREDSAAERRG